MNRIELALIISSLAGLSTVLGSLFTYFKPKKVSNFIGSSLAFSGTIMLLISVFELIPEGFFYLSNKYSIFIAILLIIMLLLVGFTINKIINKRIDNNSNLYRVGVLSMIALMIHNLPEGILTFLSTTIDLKLGLKFAFAIMLHNIPEGIAIAVPIYYATKSHYIAIKSTLISGLSEPLGALLAFLFLYRYINNTMISIILLFVAGIMISISIEDIFEEASNYSLKSLLLGSILGIILFTITTLIF